jgi:hypothetical protein
MMVDDRFVSSTKWCDGKVSSLNNIMEIEGEIYFQKKKKEKKNVAKTLAELGFTAFRQYCIVASGRDRIGIY